jgi:hypothetical protein
MNQSYLVWQNHFVYQIKLLNKNMMLAFIKFKYYISNVYKNIFLTTS